MAGGGADRRRGRVAVFPLAFQGHLSPMLQLAGALHARGLAVTVLHTAFNAPDPARHPAFSFVEVADAIPAGVPGGNGIAKILALNAAMEASGRTRDALAALLAKEDGLSCVVIDSTLSAVQKAAASLGLLTLVLHTGSAATLRLFRSYDMLHDKGYLPATDSNLIVPIKELPPLQVRDLFDPSKLPNKEIGQKILNLATGTMADSSGAIINTFEDLEAHELDMVRVELRGSGRGIPAFALGPLQKLTSTSSGGETSLLSPDRTCIEWLNTQAPNSVLYVSFGSVVHVTQDEFLEIAWGLANSGKPFLWVVRDGLLAGVEKTELPEGFESTVQGRGVVIDWAPQQEVLAHSAVGGFWTHSGWNSTLESIVEGVPMLSRPLFGDQLANGRYVQDAWKIGFLLEGVMERGMIEAAIRRLMEGDEGAEVRKRAKDLKEKARLCMESNGSSQVAVDQLVDHILSL